MNGGRANWIRVAAVALVLALGLWWRRRIEQGPKDPISGRIALPGRRGCQNHAVAPETSIRECMVHRWFARVVLALTAVFGTLTLTNAVINGGQGAWLAVASTASLLAVMVAVRPERFR